MDLAAKKRQLAALQAQLNPPGRTLSQVRDTLGNDQYLRLSAQERELRSEIQKLEA